MDNVEITFSREAEDIFSISIKSNIIIFKFEPKKHNMLVCDILTFTFDIPAEKAEILEAKICRSAMS